MFFTGDFNGHSQNWWPQGNTNAEGRDIEEMFSSLNLTQNISEPTNLHRIAVPHVLPFLIVVPGRLSTLCVIIKLFFVKSTSGSHLHLLLKDTFGTINVLTKMPSNVAWTPFPGCNISVSMTMSTGKSNRLQKLY